MRPHHKDTLKRNARQIVKALRVSVLQKSIGSEETAAVIIALEEAAQNREAEQAEFAAYKNKNNSPNY